MDNQDYKKHCEAALECLAGAARKQDELAYLHAILGINSGAEDVGWQPSDESRAFVSDLASLINTPLHLHTKARLSLMVYCHITEANFLYHDLFNLLLAADGQQPRVFNFINKYQGGRPPSVNAKLSDVKAHADRMGHGAITTMFDEIWRPDIRNAVFHSDYILFENELRIKHRMSQIDKIPLVEVFDLLQKTLHLFEAVLAIKAKGMQSFPKGYRITGRKSPKGHNLAAIDVTVDEDGWVRGFSSSDPLPIW